MTLASLRKRLKDGDALPKKATVSPRAFHQGVSGSHEFRLRVSHNQAALRDVPWNPDSDLNRITDGSPIRLLPREDQCARNIP
ncbi:MAG: hypothetical protein II818_02765 [Aeriscardovia sp.]|nr:hypothetical protein [Aeriscardovia sp.]